MQDSMSEWRQVQIIKVLWSSVSIIILICGIIGNSLSLVILLRKHLRSRKGNMYLVILVIVDTVAILTGTLISKWVEFGLKRINRLSPNCNPVQDFVNSTAQTTATYVMVCMTIERVIAVWFPFFASRRCKMRQARVVIVVIFLCICSFYAHKLLTRWLCPKDIFEPLELCPADWKRTQHTDTTHKAIEDIKTRCNYARFYFDVWFTVNFVFSSFVPLFLVVLGDLAVSFKIFFKTTWVFETKLESGMVTRIVGVGRRRASRVTQMTAVLNAVYFLTILPLVIFIQIQNTEEINFYRSKKDAWLALGWTIATILFYTRASFDFLLFYALCPSFRLECKVIVAKLALRLFVFVYTTFPCLLPPTPPESLVVPERVESVTYTKASSAPNVEVSEVRVHSAGSTSVLSSHEDKVKSEEGVSGEPLVSSKAEIHLLSIPRLSAVESLIATAPVRRRLGRILERNFTWEEPFCVDVRRHSSIPKSLTPSCVALSPDQNNSVKPSFYKKGFSLSVKSGRLLSPMKVEPIAESTVTTYPSQQSTMTSFGTQPTRVLLRSTASASSSLKWSTKPLTSINASQRPSTASMEANGREQSESSGINGNQPLPKIKRRSSQKSSDSKLVPRTSVHCSIEFKRTSRLSVDKEQRQQTLNRSSSSSP